MNTCTTNPITKTDGKITKRQGVINKRRVSISKRNGTLEKRESSISKGLEYCPMLLQENGKFLLLENGYRINIS